MVKLIQLNASIMLPRYVNIFHSHSISVSNGSLQAFEISVPLGACFCSAMYETFFSTFGTAYMFCTRPAMSAQDQDGDREGKILAKPDPKTFLIDLDIGKGGSDSDPDRDPSQLFIDFDFGAQNLGIPKNHINDFLDAFGAALGQTVMGKFPKEDKPTTAAP